jgi:collagenase-like PrtC family protease
MTTELLGMRIVPSPFRVLQIERVLSLNATINNVEAALFREKRGLASGVCPRQRSPRVLADP